MNSGLVYVFTGEGKGKTSASLGVATRSLLNGERVVWVAFYKQESWGLSEAKLKEKFPNLEMVFVGKGFRIVNPDQTKGKVKLATVGISNKVIDTASEEEHTQAAKEGLELVRGVLSRKSSDHSPRITQGSELESQKPFLLVMDEVLNAVSEGILEEKDVLGVIEQRGAVHMVLSGRGVTENIMKAADLVTECKKVKHPYDVGKLAVKGLDF
jgi:cob(I)alamin adenosyltransferase